MNRMSPTDFLKLMNEIINVRKFKDQEVSHQDLNLLLEAFRNGASTANQQPWEVLVLTKGQKEKLVEFTLDPFYKAGPTPGQPWIKDAPVLLLITLEERRVKARVGDLGIQINQQDTFGAIQNLRLMAELLGLSTTVIREFDSGKTCRLLEIPFNFKPLAFVAIGYAAENKEYPPRLVIKEFVHWGKIT